MAPGLAKKIDTRNEEWVAFHFFYHSDISILVDKFLIPTVRSVLDRDLAEGFFFIRYPVGGPHVRLRFRVKSSRLHELEETLQGDKNVFLSQWRSTENIDESVIRGQSQAIMDQSPEESESFYPNNSLVQMPFHPEQDRYGGAERLQHSLTFFEVSSLNVLELRQRAKGLTKARLYAESIQLAFLQTLGFAADENELISLLGYRLPVGEEAVDNILSKADHAFERNPDSYCKLLRSTLGTVDDDVSTGTMSGAAAAGHCFSSNLGDTDTMLRWQIFHSQLHMTANRLGLLPLEELYINRLALRATERLIIEDTESWKKIMAVKQRLASSIDQSDRGLNDIRLDLRRSFANRTEVAA